MFKQGEVLLLGIGARALASSTTGEGAFHHKTTQLLCASLVREMLVKNSEGARDA